jgi:anhydro-N-acetylmuramic acid kinase
VQVKPLKVIGLNSGTSMDGIDAAVFLLEPVCPAPDKRPPAIRIEMLGHSSHEYEPSLRALLLKTINRQTVDLDLFTRLSFRVGDEFAAAALKLIKDSGFTRQDVDLIGSHGQTIWHSPQLRNFLGVNNRGTLQIGETSVIAYKTGLPVIGDFRTADIAAGGQGAPLVAFADEVIFGADNSPIGVLNLGGIANLTVLNGSGRAIMAYDTGPGNMIIDRTAQKLFGVRYDAEGTLASQGKINESWLAEIASESYFKAAPPKTTGRELFGESYTDRLLVRAEADNLDKHDCLATLTRLSARAIANSYKDFVSDRVKIKRLVLGGGGAENKTLCRMLIDEWPHELDLLRHEDFGISTQFKETLLFALLAYTTYFALPNNVPDCTGAKSKVCLGKLSLPGP